MAWARLQPTHRLSRVLIAGFVMFGTGALMLAMTPGWSTGQGGYLALLNAPYPASQPFGPWVSAPLGTALVVGGVLAMAQRKWIVTVAVAGAFLAVGLGALALTWRPEWAALGIALFWALRTGRDGFPD